MKSTSQTNLSYSVRVRIIGGEFRSRLLKSLPGKDVRPTPDRLREALFNILANAVPGCVFLDAYAGTGGVGIEALSRGAGRAIFIENSREAAALIERNLETLGLRSRALIHRGPVAKNISLDSPTIAFLDPPYPETAEYALALGLLGRMTHPLTAVAQHSSRFPLLASYGTLERARQVRQGENMLSFFRSQHTQLDRSAGPTSENPRGASLPGGDLEIPGAARDHE